MLPAQTAVPVAGLSSGDRAAIAGHVDTVLDALDELSGSPLTPDQYECLYRMLGAARMLRQLIGHSAGPPAGPRLAVVSSEEARVCRILLLDRSRGLRGVLAQCLAALPHVLDRCSDRAAALSLFRERRYDIVFADPRFAPELPAVLRIAERERGDAAPVPVVAVQPAGLFQSVEALSNAGFDAVLPRTFDDDTLIRILAGCGIAVPSPPPAIHGIRAEFLRRVRAAVEPARQAARRREGDSLLRCADFVGGAAAVLGFHLLAQASVRLRHAAARNDWTKAACCLDEIANETEIACASADIAT